MNPIFVAIDTPDMGRAIALAQAAHGRIGGVKLGLEFFSAHGPEGVRRVAECGLPVFLDVKLHDIPNTVAKAVEALAPLKPAILTVHAAGGQAMMQAAKAAAPAETKLVGVTVLTSLDESDLGAAGVQGSPAEQVARLTALARSCGIDGIVCSGAEVAQAKSLWPDGFFVVPGVRPVGADTGDQKRVVTPAEALARGASVVVIGRAITGSADPAGAMMDIAASLAQTPAEAR